MAITPDPRLPVPVTIDSFVMDKAAMDAPQLVLVPPTPLSRSSFSPATHGPPTSQGQSEVRTSSETAIVSIYSMYGDQDGHNAWTPTVLDPVITRKDACHSDAKNQPLSSPICPEPVQLETSSNLAEHESSYLSVQSDVIHPPSAENHTQPSGFANIAGNSPKGAPSQLGSRPTSTRSNSPSIHSYYETASVGRSSTESKPDSHLIPNLTRSGSDSADSPSCSKSPHQQLPEALSESVAVKSKLSAVPQSPDLPSPSPRLGEPLLTTPQQSRPPTPQRMALVSANASPMTSPSSKVSLTPSCGEDDDAFLVRSTYAFLDAQGVKGDGYEEGIERTRAKLGSGRHDADQAIADENERKRELTPKELDVLANLDRYGFFTTSSYDRLVLVPSAPLQKPLKGSRSKPSNTPTTVRYLSTLPPVPLPSKENKRISKWNRMLIPNARDSGGNIESWTIRPSKQAKLRRRVYKGIPDRWRAAVWDLLISQFASSGFNELASHVIEYREAVEKPSTYDVQIDLDVPRTISGHVLFHTRYGAGQRSLYHVLHAFSLRCGDCGYVQGMGPIAATLLCYFEPERVYSSLVRLHDSYDLHRVFSPGFPGLLESIFVQERLMRKVMPKVYAAFSRHNVSTTAYATKWYITLFANTVPFQTQLRLWDAFLLDGPDVFIAMSMAIVWVYRDHIISRSASFETVLSLLSSFFVPEDEDALLFWIRRTLGNHKLRASMAQWRVEWRNLVKRGEDTKALL